MEAQNAAQTGEETDFIPFIVSQASQALSFTRRRKKTYAISCSSGNVGVVIFIKEHEIGLLGVRDVRKGCIFGATFIALTASFSIND